MRRLLILLLLLVATAGAPAAALAQGMMGRFTASPASELAADDHTAREEAEGKEIWDKLQAKQVSCEKLSDKDFGALGEYFMGQSIGNTERHAAMNQMMTNMLGENGEEQMHITLGKRSSGCDTNAALPTWYSFMPMMWNLGQAPMGLSYSLGWVSMILLWALLALGVVALIRYLVRSGKDRESKTPLDILKERYARGEIDKKEFEEMRGQIKGD